jgi:hypothetical protein
MVLERLSFAIDFIEVNVLPFITFLKRALWGMQQIIYAND